MTYCARCGHELGVGRYCINCGHPVEGEWRTDTAERPSAPPIPTPPTPAPQEAPPAWTSPPPARFPLFADEVDDDGEPLPAYDERDDFAAYEPVAAAPTRHRRGRPWAAWVLAAAVLVLVAVVGVVLLTGGDDPEAGSDPGSTGSTPASATPSGGSSNGSSDEPSQEPVRPGEVAGDATVEVPATAPPGTDVSGKAVDFAAENMLDGRPGTTWRMVGDGTGKTITITLPQETSLTTVGLINGYAKTAGTGKGRRDWYHGNRRIQRVEWTFDDGTTVAQQLGDSQSLQTIAVDTRTTTIELRLVAVSAPGKGASRRDNTAISELSLIAG